MVSYNLQEAKGVIAAIVKESATAVLQTPADAVITFGSPVTKYIFLEAATSYGQDTNKTVNKKDVVGSINKKFTEGSLEDTFKYDALAIQPAAIADTTVEFTTGTVHGLNAATNAQYMLTSYGMRKALRSGNKYTIRVFAGCTLDANGDADITTATDVTDLEMCHIASANFNASGGGDVTISLQFEAETLFQPAAYNTLPR